MLTVGGLGMLASALVTLTDGARELDALAVSGVIVVVPGFALWRLTQVPQHLRIASIFAAVAGSWIVLSFATTLPYMLAGTFDSFEEALFESISGLTTTGASVLSPIEGTPDGVLFWRAFTQWLGGGGVIVLVVAVLPFVGAGGMELLEAEAPGPTGERLTPRVRQTAQRLWGIYVGLTAVIALGYGVFGMSVFDAVTHAFTTVATGGFSTRDASIAAFDSAAIEWVAIVGMVASGVSLALYWRAIRGKPIVLLRSIELVAYVGLVVTATGFALIWEHGRGLGHEAFRGALFSVASLVSTTGYTTVDFAVWEPAPQLVLIMLLPLGAMAGSTSGGFKMMRLLVTVGYARREVLRHLHPRMVRPVRIGRDPVAEETVSRVVGFAVMYLVVYGLTAIGVAATGESVATALSASGTTLANVGPGVGEIGPTANFLALDPAARIVTMVSMLVGRLEIYPFLLALAALPRLTLRSVRPRRRP